LEGLDPEIEFSIENVVQTFYGDELMNQGILLDEKWYEIPKENYAKIHHLKVASCN
jgi:hypothetical protein